MIGTELVSGAVVIFSQVTSLIAEKNLSTLATVKASDIK
jgi:hypothetical protein